MKTVHHRNALTRVQKHFPNVKFVKDSNKTITIRVTEADSKEGTKKDPAGCALARACVREKHSDGAIIGIGTSWLIKGNTAIRYKTSQTVAREIVSFDRHQDFAIGKDYKLSRISPKARLGANRPAAKGAPHPRVHGRPVILHKAHTSNVRITT
jgi:hypothetical protein